MNNQKQNFEHLIEGLKSANLEISDFASIDKMVGEIENHDALIKAAINGQQKKLAAARMQLTKLRNAERRPALADEPVDDHHLGGQVAVHRDSHGSDHQADRELPQRRSS